MLAMDADNLAIPRAQVTAGESEKYLTEFRIGRRHYTQQYNKLYYKRLETLKPFVQKHAQHKWEKHGHKQPIQLTQKVLNVEGPEPTYIIGSIFIDTPEKPSTLEQVEKTHWITDTEFAGKYRGPDDALYLEDESGRIRLVGKAIEGISVASGVIIAAMGSETANGDFDVVDICFAGMAPQPQRRFSTEDKYVALVSGFNATVESPVTLEMQLLAEYLAGTMGSEEDQRRSAQIVQTVVLGQIIEMPEPPLGHTEDAKVNDRKPVQQLLATVDAFLADIAGAMPLTLLPGKSDPADISMPQQPLHPSLFAHCKQYSGFRTATNPAYFEIDGTLVLASAGQNVDDLCHYAVRDETPCQLAARTLQWRHIAPSAPDTLWSYPFTEYDPFVVRNTPHVYVVGNQKKFDICVAEGTDGQTSQMIMVPGFKQSHSIVLLNLRTLECTQVHIGALATH
ncbi:DNA polymerase delta small subunit Cdc1 [Coemansia brasiliensis]|uniref:DNA polymerase delta small subunit Cdc1 n=1 Tax=Coemansia brasiliensis TaxID=2650707 RepID=A0A9W8IA70_9FUNG|nr:DNA polymerase delta small subunit Cdc1 [Coemansia brasiliensis]